MAQILLNEGGSIKDPVEATREIRTRLRAARDHRKKQEPTWQMSMAFAAGDHWSVWDPNRRLLRSIQQMDPRYAKRELYTADIINEFRMHVLGELGSDDDRPELLLQHDDIGAEKYQEQVNRALGYGWEQEWEGDEALAEADRLCIDLGTSAIRCWFDKSAGPLRPDLVPHVNGEPVFGDQAMQLMGSQEQPGPVPGVELKQVNEGLICWEPLSAFSLLTPPGITHERYFPWEAIIRPAFLPTVKEQFGAAAAELKEDRDIGSNLGVALMGPRDTGATLRDHVWLTTYFERATKKYPQGRVLHFASNDFKLVAMEPQLPYCRLNQRGEPVEWRSGITYFHFWRVTGRFWSKGLIDSLKDVQRGINKRRTQNQETIDRGQPYVLRPEGTNLKRSTMPMEVVEFTPGQGAPQAVQGIGPGPWMQEEIVQLREDAEHATGIRALALGENPASVTTLGQLTILKESESVKRQPVIYERKLKIRELVQNTVYDIKRYWGHDKQIALAGDEGRIEASIFDATKIPPFFIVEVAKGTAKPRSQGAELTKIDQLWQAAIACGAIALDPSGWIAWYKESLDAGEAMELPSLGADVHAEKAKLENRKLLSGDPEEAQAVTVAPYDPIAVHLPIHREAQIEAEQAEDVAAWTALNDHIAEHEQVEQEKAQMQAAQMAGTAAADSAQQVQPTPAPPPPEPPQ